jgi:hypothetical protein
MTTVDYTPVLLAQITDLSMRVTNLEAVNSALKAEIERLTGHSVAVSDPNSRPVTGLCMSSSEKICTKSSACPNQRQIYRNDSPKLICGYGNMESAVSSVKTSVPLTAKMHTQPQSQDGFQSQNGFQSPSGFQQRRPYDRNGHHDGASAGRGFQPPHYAQQTQQSQQPYRRNNHQGAGSAAAAAAAPQQRDGYKQLTIQDVLHLNEEVTIQVRTVQEDESVVSHATCVTAFDGVHLVVKACELVPELVGMSSTKPGEILYKFIEALTNGGHIKRAFSTAPWKLCFVERDGKRLSLEDLRH